MPGKRHSPRSSAEVRPGERTTLLTGETVAGRFELVELVGSGGMSSVFRARDRVLERDVALKILHDRLVAEQDVVDRFSREAKMVAGLSHRNIVAVIDRGDYGGKPYIVFEYIAGENLKQLVKREGPLPVARALEPQSRSRAGSPSPTSRASSTAMSSRRTCSSTARARRR